MTIIWWTLLIAVIAIGALAYSWWKHRRRRGASPLTSLGYTSLWGLLRNKNIISLIIGLVLSGLLMVFAMLAAILLLSLILPAGLSVEKSTAVYLIAAAVGGLLSYSTAYQFFQAGRFTVLPGQTAFVSFLNIPMFSMELGDAWIIPRLMQNKLVDSQAFVVSGDRETFITGNGVNVDAQMSCTVYVKEPLKFQGLQESRANVETLVKRQLSTKTRAYVAGQTVDLSQVANLENLPADKQWEFVQTITAFKGQFVKNGPEEIRVGLNPDLEDYGLEVEEGQVQVNQVSLPQQIEEAIDRIFKEIFEKVGISNDARNKAAVAEIFNEVFTKNGVDIKNIDMPDRVDIIKENLDRALANEDKARIQALHLRGKNNPTIMPMLPLN